MAIPQAAARYRRVTAALDETARQRLWGSPDGGGTRPAAASLELADLVDSFYGGGDGEQGSGEVAESKEGVKAAGLESEVLLGLVARRDEEERRVAEAVETALGRVGVGDEEGVKRKVVWWLRRRGFDAGLCKSKPDDRKSVHAAPFPSRSRHLYVDVVTGANTRYIVELNLAAEFEIARPTAEYLSLLAAFPAVFVGRPEKLRDVVRMLCAAAAASMRSRDMHVPPWRRKEYVQRKWLGPYERSTGAADGEGGGAEDVTVVGRRRVMAVRRGGWECGGGGGGGGAELVRAVKMR